MIRSIFTTPLLVILTALTAPQAFADNIADCEIVLMETIETQSDEDEGSTSAQVASYRPAEDFIASIYSEDSPPISDIDGLPIRALLCSRSDVIVSETDFKILATGVPFILSQNFDSPDSDLLTYYFKDGKFQYKHKGEGLSEESLSALTERMTEFNTREDAIKTLVAARKNELSDTSSDSDNK